MAAEPRSTLASSLPIYAILVVIGGALYVSRERLESPRPQAPTGLRHFMEEEDTVDARLWQDPLEVVLKHEEVMHGDGESDGANSFRKCASAHCLNQLGNITRLDTSILLVMVRSGRYAEDHERRLRNRYALLTALHSEGYAPRDPEHIQYVRLSWTGKRDLDDDVKANRVPAIKDVSEQDPNALLVPFEWFRVEKLYRPRLEERGQDGKSENVLIMWLPEDAFSEQPLIRMAQLIDALGGADEKSGEKEVCGSSGKRKIKVDLIGPSYSGTLQEMVADIGQIKSTHPKTSRCCVDLRSTLQGCTVFSPWSTASPILLTDNKGSCCSSSNKAAKNENPISLIFGEICQRFDEIGMKFVRTIGSDDLLAMEIINELLRHRVDVVPKPEGGGDNVALISEWDRFYGKAFPLTFATMMESVQETRSFVRPLQPDWMDYSQKLKERNTVCRGRFPKNLFIYNYIRGIDGLLPESENSEEKQANERGESEVISTAGPELPLGRSQLDYIRRLARKMKKHEVKAIGVVGTDVYDKLLLLQALREELDDVILFTIDLDERMIHQERFKWARNVIVASSYGLELSDHYQRPVYRKESGNLPPFRDNYQTSVFLACRAALGFETPEGRSFRELELGELTDVISNPRLFEIGRGCAVDISLENSSIHPPRRNIPTRITVLKFAVGIPFAVVMFLALLTQTSSRVRNLLGVSVREKGNSEKEKACKIHVWIKLILPIVVVFVSIVVFDHFRPGGEAFFFLRGVSIWPGEALRLLAGILSVWFILKSIKDLKENEDRTLEWLKDGRAGDHRDQALLGKVWCGWKPARVWIRDLLGPCDWWSKWSESIAIVNWRIDAKKGEVDAKKLWDRYHEFAHEKSRVRRVIVMVFLFFLFAGTMVLILGAPNTPCRGDLSFYVDKIFLFFSVVSTVFLIFLVVDATHLCIRFMRNLKSDVTAWEGLIEEPGHERGKFTSNLNRNVNRRNTYIASYGEWAEWFDIRFIAVHTEVVGKLIYYPFIILFIMLVARSPYFDNWNFPAFLCVIFFLNFGLALVCGVVLRREAEKSRRGALNRLEEKLVSEAARQKNDARTKWLESIIEDIKSIRKGAYCPFSENPVLRAILIPSGGMSLLTLLRFFPLAG